MRLGQLARKLDLDTTTIIKHFKKNNIEVEDNLNTKLDEEQVQLILTAFAPEVEVEEQEEEEVYSTPEAEEVSNSEEEVELEEEVIMTESTTQEEVLIEPLVTPVLEEPTKQQILTVSELVQFQDEQKEQLAIKEFSKEEKVPEDLDVAVIRAPKIELQGIKVVGKIELPENLKKTSKAKEENTNTSSEDTTVQVVGTNRVRDEHGQLLHPNKKTKILNYKLTTIPESELVKVEEPAKPKKAKEIKAEKKAQPKSKKVQKPVLTEEQIERQKIRDKRKRQRQNKKESAQKKQKSWWRQLWDAIK